MTLFHLEKSHLTGLPFTYLQKQGPGLEHLKVLSRFNAINIDLH